jgi:hypothetical protein
MTEPVNILCLKWGTRYPADAMGGNLLEIAKDAEPT